MILVGEQEHRDGWADEEVIVKRAASALRKTRVLDVLLDEDDSDRICILCVVGPKSVLSRVVETSN